MLKIKKIKPMYNMLITTMNKYEEDSYNGSILNTDKIKGSLKEYQTVVSVGPMIRDIKVGDLVKINPSRFAKKKYSDNSVKNDLNMNPVITYQFDVVDMYNKEDKEESYLLLQDRDIDYVIEDYIEEPDTPKSKKIIVPKTKLITKV